MEDKRLNQEKDQHNDTTKAADKSGGVRTSSHVEDTSNPINSGGEPTIDTENKRAVAQTRNPSQRLSGLGSKKFITGSDSDGQI